MRFLIPILAPWDSNSLIIVNIVVIIIIIVVVVVVVVVVIASLRPPILCPDLREARPSISQEKKTPKRAEPSASLPATGGERNTTGLPRNGVGDLLAPCSIVISCNAEKWNPECRRITMSLAKTSVNSSIF